MKFSNINGEKLVIKLGVRGTHNLIALLDVSSKCSLVFRIDRVAGILGVGGKISVNNDTDDEDKQGG